MFLYFLVFLMWNTYSVGSYEFALRSLYGDPREGYVEVKVDGVWGILANRRSPLSEGTVKVLCNTFGLGTVGFSTTTSLSKQLNSSVIYWDNTINCNGTEENATLCVSGSWTDSRWSSILQEGTTMIHCFPYNVTGIRLYGGVLPHEGRLEVKVGNRWSAVCYHFYDSPVVNKNAICAMLGYAKDGVPFTSSPKLIENAKIVDSFWMTSLDCIDTDSNINQCSYSKGGLPYCETNGISYPVTLKCEPAQVVNGTTPNSGIVEVGLFGKRQMLCASSNFSMSVANVACISLGYQSIGRMSAVNPSSDNTGVTFSGFVDCEGTERSLELCNVVLGQSECEQSAVVYIECLGGPLDIIPIGNKSNEGIFTMLNWNTTWVVGTKFGGAVVTNTTAKTLCNLLGYGYEGSSKSLGHLPDSVSMTDYMSLARLDCYGNETDIAQCHRQFFYPCHRCPLGPPGGFNVLTCAECEPGYFGTHCIECNCNNRSTAPCDIHTGECTDCQTGWYGTSCELDIDECVTTTCPNNSYCTNKPGSYECICRPGYVRTNDACESGLDFNETMTQSSDQNDQSNMLIILLSSINGGFLLVIILTVIIVCKYRRLKKKGKENSLDHPDTTSASERNNEQALSSDVITGEYSTIDDVAVETNLDAMKDEQTTQSIKVNDGYLRPINRSKSKGKIAEHPDFGYDDCKVVMNNEDTTENHYNSGDQYTDLNNDNIDEHYYLKLNRTSVQTANKTSETYDSK